MAMGLSKERIENRLNKLRIKPTENARLIKKWERIQRKFERTNQ